MVILLGFPVEFCNVRSEKPHSWAQNVWNRPKSSVTSAPPPLHGRRMFEIVPKAMVILLGFRVKFCSVRSARTPIYGRWMFEIVQNSWWFYFGFQSKFALSEQFFWRKPDFNVFHSRSDIFQKIVFLKVCALEPVFLSSDFFSHFYRFLSHKMEFSNIFKVLRENAV